MYSDRVYPDISLNSSKIHPCILPPSQLHVLSLFWKITFWVQFVLPRYLWGHALECGCQPYLPAIFLCGFFALYFNITKLQNMSWRSSSLVMFVWVLSASFV